MATLTITEALVKLKLTNKKLLDQQQKLHFGYVSTKGANAVPAGFKTQEEFKQEVKSRIDAANGLIRYRDKLKAGIILSNAKTKVTIGSRIMTVAEAIEYKQSIKYKKDLYDSLSKNLAILNDNVNKANANLDARADDYVTKLFQGATASEEERAKARSNWVENNRAYAVTHDQLKKTVETLGEEISVFVADSDVILSVINAKTEIEIAD